MNKKIAFSFSLAAFVLAISMAILLNPSAIGAQPQRPSFRDVVIFATNSIDLKEGVVIQSGGPRGVGDIVVNDAGSGPAVELMVGVGTTTSTGSNIFTNSIRIQNRADVGGDVFYNELKNNGSIGGSTHTPLSLPVFDPGDIPAFLNGTPDDSNGISVRQNQSLNIPPGNYGDIDVKNGASIIFSGMGIYNVRSLNAGPGANVLFDAAGEVEVRVAEDFITGQRTTVGPVSGAIIDASDIIFYVAGDGPGGKGTPVADIGKDGHIMATIYVKEGKLTLRSGTLAQGAFFATDVVVGSGAIIQFDSFFGNEPPVAKDDAYSTDEDTLLTVSAPGVLGNDSDADGDPISAVLLDDADNGILALSPDGAFTYAPDANYHGIDSFTYKANDGTADSDTATVSLTVNSVNDPPTDITLDNNTASENNYGAVIGNLSVTDLDVEDTHTYSIDDPRFEAISNQLKLKAGESLDYETEPTVNLDITATDSGNPALSYIESFTITVNDINEPPVVDDQAFSVDENSPNDTVVGTVAATDPDIGDSITYTIISGDPSGAFTINSNTGEITVADDSQLDYKTTPSFALEVEVEDTGFLTDTATITIDINDVNEAPMDIALDSSDVDENQPAGTTVGNLSTSDPDIGDTHTYTLIAGPGAIDNGSFQIVGSQLQTAAIFSYETQNSYSIRIRTTDLGGLWYEEVFTITLNDVNEPPVVNNQAFSVDENSPNDTVVGTVAATDPDIGDSITYTIISGDPSGAFTINSNTGEITVADDSQLDYKTTPSFALEVEVEDTGFLTDTATITIDINDVNEAPMDIALDSSDVDENQPAGTTVGNLSTSDPDIGDTHTYTLIAGPGAIDNGSFQIVGSQLQTAAIFSYETQNSYSTRIRTTDLGGLWYEEVFTITVNDVNEPPLVTDDAFETIGNTLLEVSDSPTVTVRVYVSGSVLDNDNDDDGDQLTASVNTISPGAVVNMNADGTFTYTPPPGTTGTDDAFTYDVSDGSLSSTGMVTITLLEQVWYVDNTATAPGTGTSSAPFTTLAAAEVASTTDDIIFIFTGSDVTGQDAGITLNNNQQLIGQGVALEINVGVNGNTAPTLIVAAGSRPAITNTAGGGGHGITLASNNTIRGLNIGNTTGGEGISGSGVGTLAVNEVIISGTGGAVDVDGGTLDVTFDSLEVSGGASTGINLANVTGNFTVIGLTSISSNLGISITGSPTITCDFSGGMVVTSTAGSGLVVVNAGTVTIGGLSNTVEATGGAAVHVSNTDLGSGWTFSVLSSDGGTNGVFIEDIIAGDVNAGGGTIQNSTGTAFHVHGGNNNIVYEGAVDNSAGHSVIIENRSGGSVTLAGTISDIGTGINISSNTGGTVTLSGSSVILNTGANNAVTLSNNTGTTINFTGGGLDIDTTSGHGFSATGGAAGINITGSNNTIYTTTGMALNVTNTDIGSSGLTFQSISAGIGSGSSGTGILLNNTGTSSGLTITGDGSTAGSGGTIQHKTGSHGSESGVGIWLNQTQDVSLSFMQLNDFENFAIRGTDVTNFALDNSIINGSNGNSAAFDEGSIRFDNLFGSANFTNSNISGGLKDNILVTNDTGTLNPMLVTSMNIGANDASLGNDGVLVEARGSATVNITVENSTFTSARGDLFQANGLGTSTMDVVFTNNTLSNNHPNIVSGGGGATFSGGSASSNINYTYEISGNTFRDAVGNAITVNFVAGSGTVNGTIQDNDIGASGVVGSGSLQGSGISVGAAENVSHTVLIDSNTVIEVKGWSGIDVVANVDVICNFTITNNSVTLSNSASNNSAFAALYTMVGGTVTDIGTANFDIGGNVFNASGAPWAYNAVYMDQISTSANYNLPGYTGSSNGEFAAPAGTASADIHTYLTGLGNTMTNGSFSFFPGGVDAGIVSGVTGTP